MHISVIFVFSTNVNLWFVFLIFDVECISHFYTDCLHFCQVSLPQQIFNVHKEILHKIRPTNTWFKVIWNFSYLTEFENMFSFRTASLISSRCFRHSSASTTRHYCHMHLMSRSLNLFLDIFMKCVWLSVNLFAQTNRPLMWLCCQCRVHETPRLIVFLIASISC